MSSFVAWTSTTKNLFVLSDTTLNIQSYLPEMRVYISPRAAGPALSNALSNAHEQLVGVVKRTDHGFSLSDRFVVEDAEGTPLFRIRQGTWLKSFEFQIQRLRAGMIFLINTSSFFRICV